MYVPFVGIVMSRTHESDVASCRPTSDVSFIGAADVPSFVPTVLSKFENFCRKDTMQSQ